MEGDQRRERWVKSEGPESKLQVCARWWLSRSWTGPPRIDVFRRGILRLGFWLAGMGARESRATAPIFALLRFQWAAARDRETASLVAGVYGVYGVICLYLCISVPPRPPVRRCYLCGKRTLELLKPNSSAPSDKIETRGLSLGLDVNRRQQNSYKSHGETLTKWKSTPLAAHCAGSVQVSERGKIRCCRQNLVAWQRAGGHCFTLMMDGFRAHFNAL